MSCKENHRKTLFYSVTAKNSDKVCTWIEIKVKISFKENNKT